MTQWEPDFFWIGASKAGSTWTHSALREHPEVFVPESDHVRYFDVNYWKGKEWYAQFYESYIGDGKRTGDFTPTYLSSVGVAERIKEFNPKAKILVCLRNPIDRAFSHYWHLKKQNIITIDFDDVFDMPNFFQIFVRTGFYDDHLEPYFRRFPRENIKVLFFDQFREDNLEFYRAICEFLNVDTSFEPSILGRRLNRAGMKRNMLWHLAYSTTAGIKRLLPPETWKTIRRSYWYTSLKEFFIQRSEYGQGMKPETRRKLRNVYERTFSRLPDLLEKEIPNWS